MAHDTTTDSYTSFGKNLMKQLEKLKGKPYVEVGFPQSQFAKQHKGEGKSGAKTIGYIATVQEFGSPEVGIPSRSFIRATFDSQNGKWSKITKKYKEKVIKGEMTVEKALGLLGELMVADQRKTIKRRIPPPLAASTIEGRLKRAGKKYKSLDTDRAGSMTPLIDTGQLISEIYKKVVMNGKK